MSYIKKVYRKVQSFDSDTTLPFSAAKVDGVSTDTTRKILHRLHNNGIITIVSKGHFKKEKEPFNELLFVYGSLKKGFDNHNILGKYAKRLGKAHTVKRFAMFEDSFGNYPYLVNVPLTKIQGELYKITRVELMQRIDKFEGVPDYYTRKKIEVKSHHGVQRAFVYIREDSNMPADQQALKEWTNNVDYKIGRLHSTLDAMIEG
jgi:gamma-glutamylcyclotransferase (GGCT)/AIG2-like uncharacterized protein YtfP